MFISSGLVVLFLSANLLITETRSVGRAAAGGSNLKLFEKVKIWTFQIKTQPTGSRIIFFQVIENHAQCYIKLQESSLHLQTQLKCTIELVQNFFFKRKVKNYFKRLCWLE